MSDPTTVSDADVEAALKVWSSIPEPPNIDIGDHESMRAVLAFARQRDAAELARLRAALAAVKAEFGWVEGVKAACDGALGGEKSR